VAGKVLRNLATLFNIVDLSMRSGDIIVYVFFKVLECVVRSS
jgi:hypothetical protein